MDDDTQPYAAGMPAPAPYQTILHSWNLSQKVMGGMSLVYIS